MKKRLKKKLYLVLTFILMFSNLIVPTQAHDVYMFIPLIDNQTFSYKGYVVFDKQSATNDGTQHLENKLAYFQAINKGTYNSNYLDDMQGPSGNSTSTGKVANGSSNIRLSGNLALDISSWIAIKGSTSVVGSGTQDKNENAIGSVNNLIFSFPSMNIDNSDSTKWGLGILGGVNNATALDQSRAYYVKDEILQNLNQALYFINFNKNYTSVQALIDASQELAKGGRTTTGYDIVYNTSDYTCTITSPQGTTLEFKWGVEKGYTQEELEDGLPNALYRDNYRGTTEYITWTQCIELANFCYMVNGYSASNISSLKEPSAIVKGVTEVIGGLLDGVRSSLGLWDLDDLFFNRNMRGNSHMYLFGAMTIDRYNSTVSYYKICLIIAWTVLDIALTYAIFQMARTSSTMARINGTQSMERLFLTALFLGLTYPFVKTLLEINALIVEVFGATQTMPFKNYIYSAGIENILLEIYYFFIMVYFNIMYIIREYLMIILISAAPIFIVTLSFDAKGRHIHKWISLMVYCVFMQSIHVFCLSVLLPNIVAGRGVEQAVGYFVLIPITTAIKTALLGKEGAFMGTLSALGAATATSIPLMAGAGMVRGATLNKHSGMGGRGGAILNDKDGPLGIGTIRDETFLSGAAKPLSTIQNNGSMLQAGLGTKLGQFTSSTGANLAKGVGATILETGANLAMAVPYMGMGLALGAENPAAFKTAIQGTTQSLGMAGVALGGGSAQTLNYGTDMLKEKGGELIDNNPITQKLRQKQLDQGKVVNPLVGAQAAANGGARLTYNRSKLALTDGVISANNTGRKGEFVSINYGSKINPNVETMRGEYSKAIALPEGSDERNNRLSHLRDQGVESVSTNDRGDTIVTYNDTGKEKMNIDSVQTSGRNVFVSKQHAQDMRTNWSFGVSAYQTAPPAPISSPIEQESIVQEAVGMGNVAQPLVTKMNNHLAEGQVDSMAFLNTESSHATHSAPSVTQTRNINRISRDTVQRRTSERDLDLQTVEQPRQNIHSNLMPSPHNIEVNSPTIKRPTIKPKGVNTEL